MITYNENDAFAANWLESLISAGHLPAGRVDKRSIKYLKGGDCGATTHLFAGIGGWPFAQRLAGWSGNLPIWTGSCPCQPYSAAGKGKGDADERNLWPEMFRLIRECIPPIVVGEQVEAAIGHGWLDGVFADLEGCGYACAASVLPAASVGAPHIRHRLFWVAIRASDAEGDGYRPESLSGSDCKGEAERRFIQPGRHGAVGGTSLAGSEGLAGRPEQSAREECKAAERTGDAGWRDYRLHRYADGKVRRIPLEPAFYPLAHGVSAGRLGVLRGAGNAIVPQVAAVFLRSVMEILEVHG